MSSKSSMLAPSSSLSILEETVSSRLSFDAPLAAHNTLGKPSSFRGLKRLDLNFTSSSGSRLFLPQCRRDLVSLAGPPRKQINGNRRRTAVSFAHWRLRF
eukprot:scaffold314998_cov18-Tisochrysis_lutea.AAC.1